MKRAVVRTVVGTVGLVVTLVLGAGQVAASPGAVQQFFRSCDEANAAGFTDIRSGDPAYAPHLDGDGDGVACEEGDTGATQPAPDAQPAPEAQAAPDAPPAPEVGAAEAGAVPAAEVQGVTEERLASTGVSWYTPVIAAVALGLFLSGRWFMRTGYEHLPWQPGRQPDTRFTVERVRRRHR